MTLLDFEQLLTHVQYKPGWAFTLRHAAAGFAYLEIQCPVPDSRSPHQGMTIAMSYAFNEADWVNADRFFAFVRASVARTEQHEFNEFFRVAHVPWPNVDHATF